MKKLIVIVALFALFSVPAMAQDWLAPDYIFGGIALNPDEDSVVSAAPFLGGAYKVSDEKNMSWTSLHFGRVDPQTTEGGTTFLGEEFQLTVRTGLARQLFKVKAISVYALADVGIVTAGGTTTSSVGWGGFVRSRINDWLGAFAVLQGERSPLLGTDMAAQFGVDINWEGIMGY